MPIVIDQTRQFVMIPFDVIDACPSVQSLAVWVILKKYANHRTSQCFPSRKTIARNLGYRSPGAVDKGLRELQDLGLVDIIRNQTETENGKFANAASTYIVRDLPQWMPPVAEQYHEPVYTQPQTTPEPQPVAQPAQTIETTEPAPTQVEESPATIGELIPVEQAEPPAETKPTRQKKTGHRLPEGWMPQPKTVEKIVSEYPTITREWLQREHDIFTDYWVAQPGAKGRKVDWEATWRNWMRRSAGNLPQTRPRFAAGGFNSTQIPTDDRMDIGRAIAAKIDAEGGIGSVSYTGGNGQ